MNHKSKMIINFLDNNREIIKSGKTIDNFTAKVDRNKIDYLN